MSARRLFTVLGALYLAQGLPFGFFTQALPVMLRARGASLELVGLGSLLALPWALKFLLAPLVDRFGSRRSWLLGLQGATALVLAAAAFIDPGALRLVLATCFVVNALAATQDIATDALAVESLARSQRGFANGLQVGAYRVGMVVGGGALLLVFDALAWRGVFLVMALLVALTTVPVLWLDGRRPSVAVEAASLRAFWRRPDAVPLLALLATYKFGEAFAVAMLRPRLVDLGLTLPQLGWLVGTVGFAAGLAGALVGGALVTRLGRRRALVLFGAAQALAVLGYAQLGAATPAPTLALALGLEHFSSGLATAALFTCIMDWSRADAAGTDATVQASTVVIATGLASALAGFSAARLGYQAHFIVAALLACAAVGVVAALFPLITQQEPKGETPCASPSTQAASTR